jgi:biotin operon repressor
MSNELSKNEFALKEIIAANPETSSDIADVMDISISYVYDLVEGLRRKGIDVQQDADGRYYTPATVDSDVPTDAGELVQSSGRKASVTRQVKKLLAEMEYELKRDLDRLEPAIEEGGPVQRSGGTDIIIHRTDDHFGEKVTNQHGDVVFNSEIAADRVESVFDRTIEVAEARRDMGEQIDAAHLLLGGDIVTGEDIYDGQSHEIDLTLQEQIELAGDVYIQQIRRLSEEFPSVQVVCQPGNHGRLGSGNPTNADGILYSMLDKIVRESDMDNVTFLQSHRSYYINFSVRDWDVHLRHGHDSSLEHIGTSAGKQRWLTWLVDHGFDVAFRGHYHLYKEEPISGKPVHMGGSIVPQTEFEESHALSGKPVAAVHGATDTAPTAWTEKVYFH